MESLIEVLLSVAQVLDELNIPYLVGGSVASSLQGFPRLTNDADIVADIQLNQVPKLFAALKYEFFVDEQPMRVAVIERRSFNIIHYDSVFKIDVYIPDEFGQQQLKHRRPETLLPDSQRETYISMPEDTILSKLSWYRRDGEVSQRQLADVAGIIKVQGQKLDLSYLREWADKLNARDLLEKVLEESR